MQIENLELYVLYDYSNSSESRPWVSRRDVQNDEIQLLYTELLGREAEDQELSSSRLLLDQGYEKNELAQALKTIHLDEHLSRRVNLIYQEVFGFEAKEVERAWGSAELSSGRTEEEFIEYVGIIVPTIREIYGRAPTFDELASFTRILDFGWY